MLKRYQVMLEDWQEQHYKLMSEKYDVNFSEMIRMTLCIDTYFATKAAFPRYKFNIDEKMLKSIIKGKYEVKNIDLDEPHRFISRMYFEARKAAELWREEYAKNDG